MSHPVIYLNQLAYEFENNIESVEYLLKRNFQNYDECDNLLSIDQQNETILIPLKSLLCEQTDTSTSIRSNFVVAKRNEMKELEIKQASSCSITKLRDDQVNIGVLNKKIVLIFHNCTKYLKAKINYSSHSKQVINDNDIHSKVLYISIFKYSRILQACHAFSVHV